jgi:hypothetical protein
VTEPRRWTLDHQTNPHLAYGPVVNERVSVREDRITTADIEVVAGWLRGFGFSGADKHARSLLSAVLGPEATL